MDIGQMIHDRRIEQGLTLEEVGLACGVGKSTVRKWETGMIKNMRRNKIVLLARVLKMDPVDLIDAPQPQPKTLDEDRLEALHRNPRLGLLFDRSRAMSDADVEFMLQMADRILKERDGD